MMDAEKATPEMWDFYQKIVDIAEHNENTEGIKIPGLSDWLWGNITAGAAYFNRGLLSVGKLIGDVLGLEETPPAKWIEGRLQNGRNVIQQSNEINEAVTGKTGAGANIVRILTGGLPSAALAYGTAGVGSAAQATGTLSAAAGNAGGILQSAKAATDILAKNPNFWLSVGTGAGNAYSNALEEGATEEEALITALFSGVSDGIIEMSGGLQVPSGSGKILSRTGKIALEEGGENILQGIVDRYHGKAIYDSFAPWFSPADPRAVFNPYSSLEEGLMGAISGAVYGGPKAIIDAVGSPKKTYPIFESDLQSTDGSNLFTATLENYKNQIEALLKEGNPKNGPLIQKLMAEAGKYKKLLLKNGQEIPNFLNIPGLEFGQHALYTGGNESTLLPDFEIGKSVGAKARNYDVLDPETGEIYHFVEGTHIQNCEVFAGYGSHNSLHDGVAEGLSEQFGGNSKQWKHAKGIGWIDADGEEVKVEVHWFENPQIGKVKFRIKDWFD